MPNHPERSLGGRAHLRPVIRGALRILLATAFGCGLVLLGGSRHRLFSLFDVLLRPGGVGLGALGHRRTFLRLLRLGGLGLSLGRSLLG